MSTQLGAASLRVDAEERMGDARGPSGAQRRPAFVDPQAGRRRSRPSMESVISNLLTARESGRLHGLASMRSGAVGENENEEDRPLSAGQNEVEPSWISSDESSLVLSPADLNESSPPTSPSSPPRLSALRRKLIGARHASGFGGSYELKTISASSVEEEDEEEEEAEDATVPLRKAEKKESAKEDFDLYSWLARQQKSSVKTDQPRPTPTDLHVQPVQSQQQQLQSTTAFQFAGGHAGHFRVAVRQRRPGEQTKFVGRFVSERQRFGAGRSRRAARRNL